MGGKKTYVLRIDEGIYNAIEKWAADEFRSVNGQLEWIISQTLKNNGRISKSGTVIPDPHKSSPKK